ncbi:MAG TPA: hypothetical protein VK846_02335 [Candidatus Limnocylindria bacterium]|nr:hypothetical protein [Candidatus Limnocylindria bacterium]
MERAPVNVFELWVVEYSESEQKFAVEKFGAALECNLHAFLNSQSNDRVILAFAFSQELAEEMCRAFDCREDRTKPFTPGHIGTIKELLQAAAQRYD